MNDIKINKLQSEINDLRYQLQQLEDKEGKIHKKYIDMYQNNIKRKDKRTKLYAYYKEALERYKKNEDYIIYEQEKQKIENLIKQKQNEIDRNIKNNIINNGKIQDNSRHIRSDYFDCNLNSTNVTSNSSRKIDDVFSKKSIEKNVINKNQDALHQNFRNNIVKKSSVKDNKNVIKNKDNKKNIQYDKYRKYNKNLNNQRNNNFAKKQYNKKNVINNNQDTLHQIFRNDLLNNNQDTLHQTFRNNIVKNSSVKDNKNVKFHKLNSNMLNNYKNLRKLVQKQQINDCYNNKEKQKHSIAIVGKNNYNDLMNGNFAFKNHL